MRANAGGPRRSHAVAVLLVPIVLALAVGSGTGAARTASPLSAAAQERVAALQAADLATRAGAVRYLRSQGYDPARWVIQLGSRNYAGASCPGRGWSCTRAQRVLQSGAHNLADCSATSESCTIVQNGGGDASCTQSLGSESAAHTCSITQSSVTGRNNRARVVQVIRQHGRGTKLETAIQNTTITQDAMGTATNSATVRQVAVQQIGPKRVPGGSGSQRADSITQEQEAAQAVSIDQTSADGSNTAEVVQAQRQYERAVNANTITQLQNTQELGNATDPQCPVLKSELDDKNANQCFAVKQTSDTGPNSSTVTQLYRHLQRVQNTAGGQQAQGLLDDPEHGGMDHRFTQSTGLAGGNTQSSTQTETLTQEAKDAGSLAQIQHGPARKGTGSQTGGGTATQHQRSTESEQLPGGTQTELLSDHCDSPDGECNLDQTITVGVQPPLTVEAHGHSLDVTTQCENSGCSGGDSSNAILIAGPGDVGGEIVREPNDNLAGLFASVRYGVTEATTLPTRLSNFRQVWWVGTTPPSEEDQGKLEAFAEAGGGVFLTGEHDSCGGCAELNAADTAMLDHVLIDGGVTAGGMGDLCNCYRGVPVNQGVVGDLATKPFPITSWTPAAPGGLTGVLPANVFASAVQRKTEQTFPVAAAWDRPSVNGGGRVVIFMDVNWPEVDWRGENWAQVAQNVAFFLSGLAAPPAAGAQDAQSAPAAQAPAGPSATIGDDGP
jgi:hypothetical protein